MRTLAIYVAFTCALWVLAVALYTFYETYMATQGSAPVSTFQYGDGLIGALNYSLPTGVVCLAFLLYTHRTNPGNFEILLLCIAVTGISLYTALKAGDHAYPPEDGTLAKAVWWMGGDSPKSEDEFDY